MNIFAELSAYQWLHGGKVNGALLTLKEEMTKGDL